MQMLPEINAFFILNSFKQAGLIAGGNQANIKDFVNPTQILQMGIKIIGFDAGGATSVTIDPNNTILAKMEKISIFESGGLSSAIMCFFTMILIIIGFFHDDD